MNNDTNLKKIDASSETDKKTVGIYYTKSKKLSFSVKGLTFTNIPVLKSVQLAFFEKYTILLLQKGINAASEDELIEKISVFLNVSKKCIAEFIDYLNDNKYISFVPRKNLFALDPAIHFVLDPSLDNAMLAEFDVKNADCNKIVFIDNLEAFYLDEDFLADVFRRKGNIDNKSGDTLPVRISDIVARSKDVIDPLIVRSFNKTNMHLKSDFSYELQKDQFLDYQFEFEALLEYKYFKDKKQSIMQNVSVLANNFLPEQFINGLAEQYRIDDKLPKFIELDEEFYQKINPNMESLSQIEDSMDAVKESISPIESEIASEKDKLKELKKERAQAQKNESKKVDAIVKEIAEKEEDIKTNEQLVSSDDSDSELVKNLKRTIKELKAEKTDLEGQLSENKKNLEELTKTFEEKENVLSSAITSKEEELKKRSAEIKEFEKKHKDLTKEYNALLSKNEKKLHSVIKTVIDKYPADGNIFYRLISDISLWLDSAISASEYDAFDEVGRCIDMIRELYRKVLQAVFEVVMQKRLQNLGSYFSDPFVRLEIENMFRQKKIQIDVLNKLIIFHGLANAIGHSAENGPQKRENERRVEDFKQLNASDREKILLSIPNMFAAIDFSKNELKSIIIKLKV